MESLLDFLSSLPEKYLQGAKYEALLNTYNLTDSQVRKKKGNDEKNDDFSKRQTGSTTYRQAALEILFGLFEKQTQTYIQDLFTKHGSFTGTYKDLKTNSHPSGGRRKRNDAPKDVNDEDLMKELDELGIDYRKIERTGKARVKKKHTIDDKSDEELRRAREEFERERKIAEENLRKAKAEEEERKKKQEEEKRRQEEEKRRQEERKREGEKRREEERKKAEEHSTYENINVKYTPKIHLRHDAMLFFGVSPNYTLEEIARIRRRKALELHPDKHSGRTDLFIKMEEYYELLKWCRENRGWW